MELIAHLLVDLIRSCNKLSGLPSRKIAMMMASVASPVDISALTTCPSEDTPVEQMIAEITVEQGVKTRPGDIQRVAQLCRRPDIPVLCVKN